MADYKAQLKELGKEIDTLVNQKKKADKESERLRKKIGVLMQRYELLTEKAYNKKPFKAEVQEI